MPITSSAKKALRKDRRRTQVNRVIRTGLKTVLDKAKKHPEAKVLPATYSSIDRAVKKGIIHKNKAARLKSQIAKLVKTPIAKTR